jgi:hypothetical protein
MGIMEAKKLTGGCTWNQNGVRCGLDATHDCVAKTGEVWARLCDEHNNMLSESLKDPSNMRKMLSNWVSAGGGPAIMSKRTNR